MHYLSQHSELQWYVCCTLVHIRVYTYVECACGEKNPYIHIKMSVYPVSLLSVISLVYVSLKKTQHHKREGSRHIIIALCKNLDYIFNQQVKSACSSAWTIKI